MSGESASRSTLELPGAQEELLQAAVGTGKPVVLLLMSARPLDLRWAKENVPAIMQIWHPGTRGGEAVANLLFGDAVPGGKLPYTWPRHVGQIPIVYSQRKSHAPETEGQRYWNEESTPLFEFGFGLSYCAFEFSNIGLDRATMKIGETLSISVDVTNKGRVSADEVAQLYIHQRHGSTSRPARELKGFKRTTLAAGETRTLIFRLGPEELRYWSTAARDWVQEPTVFDVWAGNDSTAPLHASFEVTP
jgi:beta-glucosidase